MNRKDITNYSIYMKEPRGSSSQHYWILDGVKKLVKTNFLDSDYDVMEKLASDILQYLGIDCINVELGINNGENCCIIENFENDGESLYDIIFGWKHINTTSAYNDIHLCFEQMFLNFKQRLYKVSDFELEQIKCAYIRMIFGDCILGNFDRHLGNIGILFNEKNNQFRLAPSYDNAMAFKGYNLFKIYKCCIGEQSFKIDDVITYILQNYIETISDVILKLHELAQNDIERIASSYDIDLGKKEYIIKYVNIISQSIEQSKIKKD